MIYQELIHGYVLLVLQVLV